MTALSDREHVHHIVAAALIAPWVVCGLGLLAGWALTRFVESGNEAVSGADE